MADATTRAMAGIALGVAAGAAFAPRPFLRVFGIPPEEVTGAATFGWRLVAARNVYISALALRGNETARDAFLPIQLLDQVVFWHAIATRSVPRRAGLMAAGASGAIIALDVARRAG